MEAFFWVSTLWEGDLNSVLSSIQWQNLDGAVVCAIFDENLFKNSVVAHTVAKKKDPWL